jgi:hypothetical protein
MRDEKPVIDMHSMDNTMSESAEWVMDRTFLLYIKWQKLYDTIVPLQMTVEYTIVVCYT